MNCLILAAGQGSRLSCHHEPKPLVPVGGLPLLERVILAARAAVAGSGAPVAGGDGRWWPARRLGRDRRGECPPGGQASPRSLGSLLGALLGLGAPGLQELAQKRGDVSLDLDHPVGLLELGLGALQAPAQPGVIGLQGMGRFAPSRQGKRL